jgi:transcription antitermination protein NusB
MSNRREARERVMQALYAHQVGHDEADHLIANIIEPDLTDDPVVLRFSKTLFIKTIDLTEEADRLIGEHTKNWDLSRIALIDRLVLRMAICEFVSFEDIPPKVTINEAIEIVKKYSTGKSGQFVNGILDATLIDLQKAGRVNKTGRGLLDESTPNKSYT